MTCLELFPGKNLFLQASLNRTWQYGLEMLWGGTLTKLYMNEGLKISVKEVVMMIQTNESWGVLSFLHTTSVFVH